MNYKLGFVGVRWALRAPSSAGSIVATPLHGEIAPFRLISPPMRFPPQAVIGGSSCARGVTPLNPHSAKQLARIYRTSAACGAGVYESLMASGPRKPGKPQGKARFPPGVLPWLSPDASHQGWPPKAAGPEAQGRQVLLSLPLQQREPSCLNASSNFRRRGCRGSSPAAGSGAAEAPELCSLRTIGKPLKTNRP